MLKQITSITDFLSYVPKLARLHDELDGLWEPDLTKDEFVNELLDKFSRTAVFCDTGPKGELLYVFVIILDNPNIANVWLFYVNKDHRNETANLIQELKVFAKSIGIKKARWLTTRQTSSYRRWVEKHGANSVMTMYEFEVN